MPAGLPPGYDHPCAVHCQLGAAQSAYARAQDLLNAARQLGGRDQNGDPVSQAKWCDQGNHAFSSRDTQAEHWRRNMPGPDGTRVDVEWDVCGPCLTSIAPPQAGPAPAALAAPASD